MNYTYFVSDGFSVKIGQTACIKEWLASLQLGSPLHLHVIAAIEGDCEEELHRTFGKYKQQDGWFLLSNEIRAFIYAQQLQRYEIWLDSFLALDPMKDADPVLLWEDRIRECIEDVPSNKWGLQVVLVSQLWEALGIPTEQRNRYGAKQITNVMKKFGFERANVRVGDQVGIGFRRVILPPDADESSLEPVTT